MPTPAELLSQALPEFRAKNFSASEALCRQIMKAAPSLSDVRIHALLGNLLAMKSEFAEAAECFGRALDIDPGNKAIESNLGSALKEAGQTDRARAVLQAAIGQHPDAPELHYNLGLVLYDARRLQEAVASFRHALHLRPGFAEAYTNLGRAYRNLGLLGQAALALEESIRLFDRNMSKHAPIWGGLTRIGPSRRSNLLPAPGCRFRPEPSPTATTLLPCVFRRPWIATHIYEEHHRWNERLARLLMALPLSHANVRCSISEFEAGLCFLGLQEHSVAFFLEPILANHDRGRFEVVCFSNSRSHDAYTHRFKSLPTPGTKMHGMTENEVSRLRAEGAGRYSDRLVPAHDGQLPLMLPVSRLPCKSACSATRRRPA